MSNLVYKYVYLFVKQYVNHQSLEERMREQEPQTKKMQHRGYKTQRAYLEIANKPANEGQVGKPKVLEETMRWVEQVTERKPPPHDLL